MSAKDPASDAYFDVYVSTSAAGNLASAQLRVPGPRATVDDGLVILFDMQGNLRHGQVSLYAGSGFKAAYLTDADRQSIFDNDMKPDLSAGDFDGALAVAARAGICQNSPVRYVAVALSKRICTASACPVSPLQTSR